MSPLNLTEQAHTSGITSGETPSWCTSLDGTPELSVKHAYLQRALPDGGMIVQSFWVSVE